MNPYDRNYKWVYLLTEGKGDMRALFGGKGAGVATRTASAPPPRRARPRSARPPTGAGYWPGMTDQVRSLSSHWSHRRCAGSHWM